MKSTAASLSPSSPVEFSHVAEYYTRTTSAVSREWTHDELLAISTYYMGATHQDVSGPAWFGSGVQHLGLVEGERVTVQQMRRILEHLNPETMEPLRRGKGHSPTVRAIDLTFSVEKDLSVIYMLADDLTRQELATIVHEANARALHHLEQDLAVVRRGAGGHIHRNASGLVAVRTQHTNSRPVDGQAAPHLHEHFVIMNIAEEGGRWTALDATRLFDSQTVAGAIAGQYVREKTAELLGITWEQGDRGIHRIAGFDASLRSRMSPRRRQILEKAIELGMDPDDPAVRLSVQRSTREAKGACGNDPSAAEWAVRELEREGVTFETLLDDARQATANQERARADRETILTALGPQPSGPSARDWFASATKLLASREETKQPGAPFAPNDQGLARDAAAARVEAALKFDPRDNETRIAETLAQVGREKSVWRRRDLVTALCNAGYSVEVAEAEARTYINDTRRTTYVVGIEDEPNFELRIRTADLAHYASVETLRKERELIDATRAGVGQRAPLLTEDQFAEVTRRLADDGIILDPALDQHRVLSTMLLGTNSITLVAGLPGTGKTTIQRGLTMGNELAGGRTFGTTLTASAAEKLAQESGMETHSLQMLLHRLNAGALVPQAGDVLVVDEVSQAGTFQLNTAVDAFVSAGGRAILVGDPRQLQSVQEVGGMFRTMMREVPGAVVRLNQIRRQVSVEERAVLGSIHDNFALTTDTREALARDGASPNFLNQLRDLREHAVTQWYLDNDRIAVAASATEAMGSMATEYWARIEAGETSAVPLVVARTNSEVAALDRMIIDEGVRRGHLNHEDLVDFGGRAFHRGQLITTRKIERRHNNVKNGERYSVLGIEAVASEYKVKLDTHTKFGLNTVLGSAPAVGDSVKYLITPGQVSRIREKIGAGREILERQLASTASSEEALRSRSGGRGQEAKRGARLADLAAKQADLRQRLEGLRADAEWAESLPTDGGEVLLAVLEVTEGPSEERLKVVRDDGQERYLRADYVSHAENIDSGYARTEQRSQGLDTQSCLSYNNMDLVSASRGKQTNRFFIPVEDHRAEVAAGLAAKLTTVERALASAPDEPTLATLRQTIRETGDAARVKVSENVTIVAAATDEDSKRFRKAELLSNPDAIGIAATPEMARDLANEVVVARAAANPDHDLPERIGDRLFIADQRVILTDDVEGLSMGTILTISAISSDRIALRADDGTISVFEHGQVAAAMSPTSGLTFREAEQLRLPDDAPLVVIAAGMRERDLLSIEKTGNPATLIYADPELTAEAEHQKEIYEAVLAKVKHAAGNGKQTAIDQLLAAQGQEIGLDALQAEVRTAAANIEAGYAVKPEEQARKDLDKHVAELYERRSRQKNLVEVSIILDDKAAALRGLAAIDTEIDQANHKLAVLRGEIGTSDERAQIIGESQTLRERDQTRLQQATRRMDQFVQMRVTKVIKDPQPYHDEIPRDPELPVEQQESAWRQLLIEVEGYRTKWDETDSFLAIGKAPEKTGIQLDEWLRLNQQLKRSRTQGQQHTR